MLKSAATS